MASVSNSTGWRKLVSSHFPPPLILVSMELSASASVCISLCPAVPQFHLSPSLSHALLITHQQSPCVIIRRIIPDYTFNTNMYHVQGTRLSSWDTKVKEMESRSLRSPQPSQILQLLLHQLPTRLPHGSSPPNHLFSGINKQQSCHRGAVRLRHSS